MSSQTFPKQQHLRRPAEFDRVYKFRCSARGRRVLIFAAPNDLTHPRLGLSVSKKHGGAVVRNRIKRLLRETFRLTRDLWPAGCDYVIVPQDFKGATLRELQSDLPSLANQASRRADKKRRDEPPLPMVPVAAAADTPIVSGRLKESN